MKYYKYLDLDNFDIIRQKAFDFIQPLNKIPQGLSFIDDKKFITVCPEIKQSFDNHGFAIQAIALYLTRTSGPIHVDYKTDTLPTCRINIPILNCEGSVTQFFKGGDYQSTTQKNGLEYFTLKAGYVNLIKVDEVEVIKPVIMRIQEPHRVVNNKNRTTGIATRICMTVYTDKDPVFLLED